MLVTDDTAMLKVGTAFIYFKYAKLSHFIFDEIREIWLDSTEKFLYIYPYDSFFKLKYMMCTSRPSLRLSIFGLQDGIKYWWNYKSTEWVPSHLCFSFLIPLFLKLIVACRLCVICVKEDNDSKVQAIITRFVIDYI